MYWDARVAFGIFAILIAALLLAYFFGGGPELAVS